MSPTLLPPQPTFTTISEGKVWEMLRDQLGPDDVLFSGQRISARDKDHEIDIGIAFADGGIVIAEVKGSQVWCEDGDWWIDRRGTKTRIHPVKQAREAQYALREWLDRDPRWGRRTDLRWGHAVVLPYTDVDDGFALLDAQRWQVAGRSDLPQLATFLRDVVARQTNNKRLLDHDDLYALVDALNGRGLPQRDLIGEAAEHEDTVERLSAEQSVILAAARQLNRVEVRGGAGSGKTWLAVEQARRLSREGQRVALTCYSRGLAAWLERRVAALPRKERPAYVGTFHNLGVEWGAPTGREDDSNFWEVELPERMVGLGAEQPVGKLFDAVVVDEAQDFADLWWPAALAALKDEDAGGLYVFSDEGQRVFSRFGGPPAGLVPLVLDQNLRNTRQIAASFSTLAPIRMRLGDVDGPEITFVECCRERGARRGRGPGRRTPRGGLAARGRRPAHHRQPAPGAEGAAGGGADAVLGHLLGPGAGLLRPRPRLQGARAAGGDPGAERDRAGRAVPGAPVRRSVPGPRPARRGGRPGVRGGGRGSARCCGTCGPAEPGSGQGHDVTGA